MGVFGMDRDELREMTEDELRKVMGGNGLVLSAGMSILGAAAYDFACGYISECKKIYLNGQ